MATDGVENGARVVISLQSIKKYFPVRRTFRDIFRPSFIRAVDGVSLELKEGEFFGLVGESGCGKSTLGKLIVRLLDPTEGCIFFRGQDITFRKLKGEMRRKIQMIFQNPFSSLNPRMRVKDLIMEGMEVHNMYGSRKERERRAMEILEDIGLPGDFAQRYPDELSGGQRQRVAIARAIAVEPEVLVADEPTASLDVSVRAQILELFEKIREKMRISILFISHDIHTVRAYSERVAVMYLGEIVEVGRTKDIFDSPLHPYTRLLISSVPDFDRVISEGRYEIRGNDIGEPPSPLNPPSGCKFRTRCPFAEEVCAEKKPELTPVHGRYVSCHFAGKI